MIACPTTMDYETISATKTDCLELDQVRMFKAMKLCTIFTLSQLRKIVLKNTKPANYPQGKLIDELELLTDQYKPWDVPAKIEMEAAINKIAFKCQKTTTLTLSM